MALTSSVSYIYGKATLTWFEEIFEEYNFLQQCSTVLHSSHYSTKFLLLMRFLIANKKSQQANSFDLYSLFSIKKS